MTENFKALTDLQLKVGYKEGPINTVAILGLFGEAGEVLNEVKIEDSFYKGGSELWIEFGAKAEAVEIANRVDKIKKALRDKKCNPLFTTITNEDLFDKELADLIYYANALAVNRGKTLDYYAGLSVEKVKTKSATDISHGTINQETLK